VVVYIFAGKACASRNESIYYYTSPDVRGLVSEGWFHNWQRYARRLTVGNTRASPAVKLGEHDRTARVKRYVLFFPRGLPTSVRLRKRARRSYTSLRTTMRTRRPFSRAFPKKKATVEFSCFSRSDIIVRTRRHRLRCPRVHAVQERSSAKSRKSSEYVTGTRALLSTAFVWHSITTYADEPKLFVRQTLINKDWECNALKKMR